MTTLDNLKKYTKIAIDTSDFKTIKKYSPEDATTNPSLILKSAENKNYTEFIKKIISKNKSKKINLIIDDILINFGIKILKNIPGRVSTEIDARLSFNTKKSIIKAKELIKKYESYGINRNRILIKLASTWEGIRAAQILEKENIKCNMTLLFSKIQAISCAQAKVSIISPFVGRIYDWYKTKNKSKKNNLYNVKNDQGINLVKNIYLNYKKMKYKTEIMGASFRNIEQIIELSGCDILTISPLLLNELNNSNYILKNKISKIDTKYLENQNTKYITESSFRSLINNNNMAINKLSEGIRLFSNDIIKLEKIVHNFI